MIIMGVWNLVFFGMGDVSCIHGKTAFGNKNIKYVMKLRYIPVRKSLSSTKFIGQGSRGNCLSI